MSTTQDPGRRATITNALGVGVATGAYGISFGAVSVASGLDVLQTQALSLLMFTGGSQFALIGVLAAGGGTPSAVVTAVLLGMRNAFYSLRMASLLQPHGIRRFAAAHLTIDESTAMALAREGTPYARLAFWSTGAAIFGLWNLGTLLGAAGAAALGDPARFGLDAAIPAGFLALIWPRLRDRRMLGVALAAAAVALVLTPVLRPGVPVLVAGSVAVAAGVLQLRSERLG